MKDATFAVKAPKRAKQNVVVIGSGIGGLVSAVELAHAGFSVTVLESHPHLGGKLRQLELDDKPIDIGPTVLTMRKVFDQIFADIGEKTEQRVILQPSEILARHAWPDGAQLDLFTDPERSREAIRAFAGLKEAEGFWRFRKYATDIYQACENLFMFAPNPSFREIAQRAGPNGMSLPFKIDSLRSMWRALSTFFSEPRLRKLFARYATYYGSSPFLAPATLNLIAGLELQGVWLVQGGMKQLAHAYVDAARERGVEFKNNVHVSQIRLEGGVVQGVELDNNEVIDADIVVFNGDIAALGDGSMGRDLARFFPTPQKKKRSLSALTVAMTTETSGFPLREHNVFFDDRPYAKEFDEIFKRGRLPTHPTVYIRAQDRDNGANPKGQAERLFLIINAPPTGDSSSFSPSEVEPCLQAASDLLNQCGLVTKQSLAKAQIFTPADYHRMFPSTGGALYGQATHSMWTPMRRASSKTKVPGLYLASGSIHPGAGVPMAALGGRQAANAVLCDLGLTELSPMGATHGGTSMDLIPSAESGSL